MIAENAQRQPERKQSINISTVKTTSTQHPEIIDRCEDCNQEGTKNDSCNTKIGVELMEPSKRIVVKGKGLEVRDWVRNFQCRIDNGHKLEQRIECKPAASTHRS